MDDLSNTLANIKSDESTLESMIKNLDASPAVHAALNTLLCEFTDLRRKSIACRDKFDSQTDSAFNDFFDDPLSSLPEQKLTSVLRLSPLHISVEMAGIQFLSVMHAFQASKVLFDKKYKGRDAMSCQKEQKTRMEMFAKEDLKTVNNWGSARGSIDLDVSRWDNEKTRVMRQLLETAYKQDAKLRDTLKTTTGDIFEDVLPDHFWGYACGEGQNIVGQLWQDIRDQKDQDKKTKKRKSESA